MFENSRLMVRQAAVLGAGVMGAQIAAHLANADVPVLLFDLPAAEGPRNGVVNKALEGLKKLSPGPLATRAKLAYIDAANYEEHLPRLAECDLIIEAIAEKREWKDSLFRQIAPHLGPQAILASNTSGLSINGLADSLPEDARSRFCGIHFFNPPRYMPLVELIPTRDTDPAMADALETWLTRRLGKGVIRAKDTPNFIANRVGVFSILAVMHHTARLGLGFDEVDALTGPLIGRPKSATYRTADVVGLDTLAHVVKTMQDTLPDDPWHGYYQAPAWLADLIAKGALGQKTKGGVFRKAGKEIQVLDPASGEYRAATGTLALEVAAMLKEGGVAANFAALRASPHPQAQFLWAIFRDVFHYCAVHLGAIADNARDLDFALRWGFGWQQGPFETWQAAGWQAVAAAIQADIDAGLTMSPAPLPAWVMARDGVHEAAGSWSAADADLKPRSSLPVYARQLYPQTVLGQTPADVGTTVWEQESVRLWTHPLAPTIAILSFKTKMHAIGAQVLAGIHEAIARAEADYRGLVLWHPAPFAVGANLKEIAEAIAAGQVDRVEPWVKAFQDAGMALKYAQVPTVAAVEGMALGGGCEYALQCAHRVLALESNLGLVEAGVGLIPSGGGCKELALQGARMAEAQFGGDPFPYLQQAFNRVAYAQVSKSAYEAMDMGFAKPGDDVVFHPAELLYVALKRAEAMAEAGYRPPLKARKVKVAGRSGIATLEMMLVNLKEGGFISDHDFAVARAAAVALCGGPVEPGSLVDEQWLLDVERREFMTLLGTEKTQARIQWMLEKGKPLRN